MEAARHKGPLSEEELRDVFQKFDLDGSGSIDENELNSAMRVLGLKCSPNSAKKILKSIDSNGNGLVEWPEFKEYFSRVSNPEEIKELLSKQNQRYFEYKLMVEGDPSFARTFAIPPIVTETKRFEGHNGSVEAVAWLSDTHFVSGSIDGDIMFWNSRATAKYPRPERVLKVPGALYNMAASEDGRRLLTGLGTKSENLHLWDATSQEDTPLNVFEGHEMPVYSVNFSKDGTLLASGGKGGVVCLHDPTNHLPKQKWRAHEGVVYSVAMHPQGQMVCSASADGTVKVFDARHPGGKDTETIVIEDAAASGNVFRAVWRKDTEILSCGDDYCIKRWDIRSARDGPVGSYFGHTSVVRALGLSQDERFMVSGTSNGSVRVWLADEEGLIGEMSRESRKMLDLLAEKRNRQEELLTAGDLDPQELKDTIAKVAKVKQELKRLAEVETERASLGCTQSKLGLNSPTLPISAVAWRDLGGDMSCVAVASQDQTIRTFNIDTTKLSNIEAWRKD